MLLPVRMFFMSLVLLAFFATSGGAVYYPPGDLDEGRDVDFDDLRLFSQGWLDPNCIDSGCVADLNGRGGINGVDFAILARNWGGIAVITEFMASNHSTEPLGPGEILDEDGEASDWIEIFNPTDTTVNLSGWYLTHDRDELTEWRFPAVELSPGEFMIIFASENNRRDPAPDKPLHTNFNLNAGGDYLALVRPDGLTIVSEYAPTYPTQLSDISYGLAQYAEVLVPSQAEVSYYVPTTSDAQTDWTNVEFDDSGWDTGTTGLGFAQVQTEVIDVTTPGDVVQGVPNDNDWPGNEAPPLAIDNDITKKYLHFKGDFDPGDPPGGAGFQVTPSIGASIVRGLTFTTANDAPERDPTAFALYGSNTSINGPYTLITTGSIVDFDQTSPWERHTKNVTPIRFANNKAYYHYQLMFPAIRDPASSVAMQIGEVELMGSPAGSAVSNIEELMLNTSASLWVRAEFQAEEVDFFSTMTLRAKYEDGFVAYLNGSEIGRRNFTGVLSWNSTADSNRPGEESEEFVSIDVSDHLDSLREGTNILAIQALNDSKDDREFLILPELAVAGEVSVAQYFTTATPGQYNTSGSLDLVADTVFSRDRGFYDASFSLTIDTETEGATIRYTTDGSTPSETHGNEYVGPIDISTTTCVRAMAFKPQWMSTNVDTHTYVFLDDVVHQPVNPPGFPSSWNSTTADYEMDPDIVNDPAYQGLMRDSLLSIPTMSIVTDVDKIFGGSGIYSNSTLGGVAWERKASVEWIWPDSTTGFQVDAGLRIYGGDPFRGMSLTRKKSFRLLFKRIHGPTKLNFQMFDAPDATDRFDTIVLRAGSNDAWNNWSAGSNAQYILDEYMRRTQSAMGQVSPHGTFVHLYINGLYWGLYNPVERPMASFCASYYGGDKEDWDALNSGTPTGESNTATWSAMMSQASAGLSSNTAFQKIQGNNTNGTPNPAYDDLLDMDNYIDWLFSNFWGGTADWPYHNFYAGCHRPPNATGFKFFNWDAEYVMVIGSGLNSNVTGVSNNGARPYVTLRQNAEFKMLFADHVQRHLFDNGPATSGPSYARYKDLADEIELAIISESARWGDMARSTPYTLEDWRGTRDHILNTYMPQRPAKVLDQLRGAGLYPSLEAPEIHVNGSYQHGGEILPTDQISMVLAADIFYIDTELVAEGALVRAHVPIDDRLALTWTAKTFTADSDWTDGTTGTGVGYEAGSGYENWIDTDVRSEMYNRSTSVFVRISFDWGGSDEFDKLELHMRHDDGFIAYLNGTRVCTSDNVTNEIPPTATAGNHEAGSAYVTFDITDFKGVLSPGPNLLAIHGINVSAGSSDMIVMPKLIGKTIDDTSLSMPILYTTDGSDPRVLWGGMNPGAIEYTGAFTLSGSKIVKTRTFYNNQWSALNEATFGVGPVRDSLRITELMFHPRESGDPNDPNEEFIELKNIGTERINLNLVRFTNGIDFTFGDTELPADGLVVIVRDQAAFDARYPSFSGVMAGQYSGSLDNGGERIELIDAIGQSIQNFKFGDDWRPHADGKGFSLTIIDPYNPDPNSWGEKDSWRASVYEGGSPGTDDSGILPNPGAIVINEIMAHSHAAASDWMELYNTTDSDIDIGGWYLSDSAADLRKYQIADGETIRAHDYRLFYEDANFGQFSADPGRITGFAYSENGDQAYLSSAEGGVLLGYREYEDFGASPTGISFGRHYKASTGNYNFVLMDSNTPGWANSSPKVGPIVINEIMYNPATGIQAEEYIELHNITSTPVTLYDIDEGLPWKFTDGIDYTFPNYPGLTIPAKGYVLIVKDVAAYMNAYGFPPPGFLLLGPYTGGLSNGGEKLELSMPGDEDEFNTRYYIRIDRVNYSDGSHHDDAPNGVDLWPIEADAGGKSLTRKVTSDYGNDVANWHAQDPSPGLPNPDLTSY